MADMQDAVGSTVRDNQVATLRAKIEELTELIEGDGTLGGTLLVMPEHEPDALVADCSSEWLADELNYRPRRAIREWLVRRRAEYQEMVNDLVELEPLAKSDVANPQESV